jgi:porphobilinogen synthase
MQRTEALFPRHRGRRLRAIKPLRDLTAEARVEPGQLVMPYFVRQGLAGREPIQGMPGIERLSLEELVKECQELLELGVRAVLLFGIPQRKDELGSEAYSDDGIVQRALRRLKREFGEQLLLMTDVCLCQYTSSGHCGVVVREGERWYVDNDRSLELLAKVALSHARAGADVVAPSDMMDGRVGRIREALDDEGFKDVAIMAYSAKYASCLYAPFREAAGSAPAFGDRRSYQLDPRNAREGLREAEEDIAEGADIVMVKPALWYLDMVRRVREAVRVPLAAYSVSGEYAMIKFAAQSGVLQEDRAIYEALHGIRRAGADIIITYFAKQYAQLYRSGFSPF